MENAQQLPRENSNSDVNNTKSTATPAVIVSGFPQNTTEKYLADFFSFCGKITSLSLRKKGAQTIAIIHFETEAASKTALLLSNAMIQNQSITVALYGEDEKELHRIEEETSKSDVKVNFSDIEDTLEITDMPVEEIPVKDFDGVEDHERTATSVIASMIAAGYGLGFDIMHKAKHFDEQQKLTDKVSSGTNFIKTKLHNIDEQLHISEQASNISRQLSSSWSEFDNQYQLSKQASTVASNVNQSVSQTLSSAMENPSVQNAVQSISSWGSNLTKNVSAFFEPATKVISSEYQQIKDESSKKIAEKKEQYNHADHNNNNDNSNDKDGIMDGDNVQPEAQKENIEQLKKLEDEEMEEEEEL